MAKWIICKNNFIAVNKSVEYDIISYLQYQGLGKPQTIPVLEIHYQAQDLLKYQASLQPHVVRFPEQHNILFHMTPHQPKPWTQNHLSFLSIHQMTMQVLQWKVVLQDHCLNLNCFLKGIC